MEKSLWRKRVARETGPRLKAGFDCQPQMFPPEPKGEKGS
jgi:hypothetical protein